MKNNNSILITIVLGICILIGAWYFQVFTDYEVPSRILAAILGVVITAIITQLLLSSQTNKEGLYAKNNRNGKQSKIN